MTTSHRSGPRPRRRRAAPRNSARDQRLQTYLFDIDQRIGRATAAAKSLAIALDGEVCVFGLEPTEGCLGIAELLEVIRDDLQPHLVQQAMANGLAE